jgi:CheY-like chemotaxis protein
MESFAEIKRIMFEAEANALAGPALPEPRVMIIDDDLGIIGALTTLLLPRYRLVSCLSWEEAKQKLTPDIKLVLLDIKMASKHGIEVFKLLKEERPDLRIVFHSAYPGSSERATAVEQLQHDGYLTKGEYDLSALLTTIEQAMDRPAEMSSGSPE